MKKTLITVIIAVALILAGAIFAGCGLLGIDGNWSLFNSKSNMVTTQETITGDFANIEADVFWLDVELLPSTDGTCSYEAITYENAPCTVTVENGILKISHSDNWSQHIGINTNTPSLKLYLPEDTYEKLTFTGRTSDLKVPADFQFQSVIVTNSTGDIHWAAQVDGDILMTCSTGDIQLQNSNSNTISASVSTGKVDIANVIVAGELTAVSNTGDKGLTNVTCGSLCTEATTGRTELTNVTVSGEANLLSDTGDKQLKNMTCGSLCMEATTGDTELIHVVVSGDAMLKSTTGDWWFDGFDAANITIDTDTGGVEGSFLSEKIFYVDTDTGDVNVPRSTSGGSCDITTDTGDVNIRIVP